MKSSKLVLVSLAAGPPGLYLGQCRCSHQGAFSIGGFLCVIGSCWALTGFRPPAKLEKHGKSGGFRSDMQFPVPPEMVEIISFDAAQRLANNFRGWADADLT